MISKPCVVPNTTGGYIVTVVDGDQQHSSLCYLEEASAPSGPVKTIRFQSDSFQRLIMLGKVQIKEIMEAICKLGD